MNYYHYIRSKTSKYRAKKAEYNGKVYHSKAEAADALWLDLLLNQGKIKEVKSQHKLVLLVNDKRVTTHIVDFLVTLNDGRQKFVETKGFPTDTWAIKKRLTEALYPSTPYLVNPNEKELLA